MNAAMSCSASLIRELLQRGSHGDQRKSACVLCSATSAHTRLVRKSASVRTF